MKNQKNIGECLSNEDENDFEDFSFNDSDLTAALIEASENVESNKFFVFVLKTKFFKYN